jgi:predicted Holliday junction resolvase-like endonuclease
MFQSPYELVLLIVVFAVIIAVILLIREIVCWYFKINERVKLQKTTLQTMLKLYEQNGGDVDWNEVNKLIS